MESAKIILVVFFILLAIGVVAGLVYVFTILKPKEVRFETTISKAKVIRKKYEADYTSTEMLLVGYIVLPVEKYHFEEFNVFLMYENHQFCINDKNLFSTANFGDYVKIKVSKGYDKHNNLISTKIKLFTE